MLQQCPTNQNQNQNHIKKKKVNLLPKKTRADVACLMAGYQTSETSQTQFQSNFQNGKSKMKAANSMTTTAPRDQPCSTGMQLGEHGSAMLANGQSPQTAAQAVAQLRPLLLSPLETEATRNTVEAMVARLSHPAPNEWLLARIAALLSPYYEKDTPQAIREIEAEDWLAELAGSPRWAIEAACRWWKGSENDRRHKRPFEGDIKAQVVEIMGVVKLANVRIQLFDKGNVKPKSAEPERVILTAEERAAQAAALGLPNVLVKRMEAAE